MDQIFEKVSEIIQELLGSDEVTIESHMEDDLGADSLDMIDLFLLLEEAFDIEIPDEEIFNLKTVQDICTYLDTNTGG